MKIGNERKKSLPEPVWFEKLQKKIEEIKNKKIQGGKSVTGDKIVEQTYT